MPKLAVRQSNQLLRHAAPGQLSIETPLYPTTMMKAGYGYDASVRDDDEVQRCCYTLSLPRNIPAKLV